MQVKYKYTWYMPTPPKSLHFYVFKRIFVKRLWKMNTKLLTLDTAVGMENEKKYSHFT